MKVICFVTTILLAFEPFILSGQEELHLDGGCQYRDGTEEEEIFGYDPSLEARQIIREITAIMGIDENSIILKGANVPNAKACASGGKRYILYSPTFLKRIEKKGKTRWAAFSVLAHEVGHHFNQDNFLETDPKRRRIAELMADRFSGYVLQKMKSSLDEAQAGIESFSLESETQTHPSKKARLDAVTTGWVQASENQPYRTELPPPLPNEQNAKDWYDCGVEEYNKERYAEAIRAFDNAIREKNDFASAYLRRGDAKDELKQYREAIADYNESLEIRPGNAVAYLYKGISLFNMKRYKDAIVELDAAIRFSPEMANAFLSRGLAYYYLERYAEALADYNESIRLQPDNKEAFNNRATLKGKMGQPEPAIADYTQAIRLNPKYAMAYFNRGNIYLNLKNYLRAIADYDSAIVHKPDFREVLNNRGIAKSKLERYTEAIEDYNLAVPLVECDSNLFFNRGNAYFNLKEYKLAIDDYEYAINCNPNMVEAYGNQGCALVNLGTRANLEEAIRLIDTALEINQILKERKDLSAAEKCKGEAKRLLNR